MILPLKDDVPSRSVPFVTLAVIGLNVLAYLYQLSLQAGTGGAGGGFEAFVQEFGAVPCRLSGVCLAFDQFPSPLVTIFTSMFLHGSIFHIAGNMLFLWIFGNNVEDTLGHGRFLLFYLVSGVAAAAAQTLVNPASNIPMIGASGAVSGVLGAYWLLFPYATVLTLVVFGFFIKFVHIPAVLVLGFWVVVQFVLGYLTYSALAMGRSESGGTAWFAHIGGFLAGMMLLFVIRPRRSSPSRSSARL